MNREKAMSKGQTAASKVHSLIPLEDFKAVLGIDDRDDALSGYCLITATYTIEQYCMRRLLRKRHFDRTEISGDLLLSLREYPVANVLAVYSLYSFQNPEIIKPELYRVIPDCGSGVDLPFVLSLSPVLKRLRRLEAVKAVYSAGYSTGKVPADLASACLELAAWNMARYRGRRIGMTGSVRGQGKNGEHLEMSIPLQVRQLLEPYRRKVI